MPRGTRPSSDIDEVLEQARRLVSPSEEERKKLEHVLEEAVGRVRRAIHELGFDAEVVPVGSAVRDTWLPGNYELDIFVLFPKEVGDKEVLGDLIREIASKAFGKYIQNYAEHPYVMVKLEGFDIDLVPAYRIGKGERIVSSVDRTPLHNSYVKSKLRSPTEVRLLKAFLKSIGAYGAEEKVGGFSGYLCEILIIYYGSFIRVLEAAEGWHPPVYIDPEDHLGEEYASVLFPKGPLVVIDPVDPKRNVAAALTLTQFNRFRVAARAFLMNPSIEFFERALRPPKVRIKSSVVEEELRRRGTHLVVVEFSKLNEPDQLSRELLWSQAKKLGRIFEDELRKHGFEPIWSSGWTDESSTIVIAAEVPHLLLPALERREGPPVGMKEEDNFLLKYVGSEVTLGGPFVREDRWYVFRRRKYREASLLASEVFRGQRLPSILRGRAKIRVLTEGELASLGQWALNEIWKELKKDEFFVRLLVEGLRREQ